jgi:CheY-like chemotaxis protein/HPt (histidine-containing phosphotransfer) domain-containing protein
MPGIDGMALAAQIRSSPPLSECPIILLTSEDQPANRDRQHELGIAAVLTKPVPEEELFATMCRVLAAPATEESSEQTAPEPAPPSQPTRLTARRPLRVLVAEDHELNQQVIQHLLARQGHCVEIAPDGRAALAALEQGGFDVLLLDVHMPELDGFQVIKALRQREQGTGRHLPVVGLTARTMKGDRERCLEAGMDDFLGKPIRRAELFAALERVLPDCHALDAATLLTACDGDEELLARMIAVFRASTPDGLERVATAVRDRNADGLREAAHRLRGVVSAFSTTAAEAALRLEQAGADRQLDGTDAISASLADMIGELTQLLDKLTVGELRSRLGQGNVLRR